jgi:hypothetical protein
VRAGAIAAVAGLALAACGGGSGVQKAGSPRTNTAPTGFSVGVGLASARISATLIAPNHSPVAGRGWPYSVRVTDRRGRPLPGTVRIRLRGDDRVPATGTASTHPLTNGRWHDRFAFPEATVGLPLIFQVLVRTKAGSVTLSWPVTVRPQ